jgi:hypothetical protein
MLTNPRFIWFPAPQVPEPVSMLGHLALASRPLKAYCSQVHSSLSLSPLQSSFALSLPARRLSTLRLYLHWVSSLFTTPPNSIPCARRSRPKTLSPNCRDSRPYGSVLRFSQPLDGFLCRLARELVPSRSHVQGSSCSRAFSPRVAALPHRENVAPLPLPERRLTDRSRLPPSLRLDFEALLHTKQRCHGLGLTAPQLAPFIRFVSPPGVPPLHPVLQFPRAIRS